MNALDILLLLLIAGSVALAVFTMRRNRKAGKGCLGCGGTCAGCTLDCQSKRERDKS